MKKLLIICVVFFVFGLKSSYAQMYASINGTKFSVVDDGSRNIQVDVNYFRHWTLSTADTSAAVCYITIEGFDADLNTYSLLNAIYSPSNTTWGGLDHASGSAFSVPSNILTIHVEAHVVYNDESGVFAGLDRDPWDDMLLDYTLPLPTDYYQEWDNY